MTKEAIGLYLVKMDILVVILFILFIELAQHSQLFYIDAFKEQTIEMDDFTLKVS